MGTARLRRQVVLIVTAFATLLGTAASTQAMPVNLKGTIPLHTEQTSPCSGALVAVFEDLHWIGHLSDADPVDRELQLLHTNATNGIATSVTTGETYRFVSATTIRDDFSGAPFASSFVSRQRFVGLGTGDSFVLAIHLLLVVDADDVPRAEIQKVEFECVFN